MNENTEINEERNIYAYSTEIYIQKYWFKVGETGGDVDVRVSQQDGTSNPEAPTRIKDFDGKKDWTVRTTLTDKEIRDELVENFLYDEVRKDKKREWVVKVRSPKEEKWLKGLSDEDRIQYVKDELITDINKVIKKRSIVDTRKVYDPYFYKVYIDRLFFAMLVENLKENKNLIDFALELAPRFGKTTWMINLLVQLFKEYNYRVCILPSYWLSSLSSFEKDLYSYNGFDDYIHYVKDGESISDAVKQWYGKKLIVIELSLHMNFDKFESQFESVINLDDSKKISMIDEADFGAWKQMKMIKRLGCSLNVYMSGSGLDKMVVNLKNVGSNVIQWSYTDMLLVKSGEHPLFF